LVTPPPAPLRTIFHVIPAFFPFFAPGKRQSANGASFCREIGFFTLSCHGQSLQLDVALFQVAFLLQGAA